MKTTSLLAASALLISATALPAATIITDVNAQRINDWAGTGGITGTGDTAVSNVFFAGDTGGNSYASVYVFQMTGFSSGGQFGNADFSITRDGGIGDADIAVDVLRISSTIDVVAGDYQLAFASRLETNFGDGGNANYNLVVSGESSLTSYLQNNWVENDYLFIRLGAASIPQSSGELTTAYYQFGSAQGGWEASSTDALLTITVPEPSSTALLGLGGLALALRRRRS